MCEDTGDPLAGQDGGTSMLFPCTLFHTSLRRPSGVQVLKLEREPRMLSDPDKENSDLVGRGWNAMCSSWGFKSVEFHLSP